MYTQCPECRTIFEIDEEALQASLGIVQCGHCRERFDALSSLSDTLPESPELPLTEPADAPRVLTLTAEVSPEALKAAAHRKRLRPRTQEAPAAAAGNRPDEANTEAWLAGLQTDLTAALIADAAGLPPGSSEGGTWGLDEEPVQARFTELDIIPLTPEELATIESQRHAPPPDDEAAAEPDGGTAPDADEPDLFSVQEQGDPANGEPAPEAAGEPGAAIDSTEPLAEGALEDGTPIAPMPVYVRPRGRAPRRAGWAWAGGCCVLALLLAAQLAWAKRVALFQDPATRPWVVQACSVLPCRLPPVRDIARLQLLSRDVRPDPAKPGALVITATLRNDARVRQAWPIVTVSLNDIDGNPVAMRRFRPAEYMPDPARRAAGIAAGATAAVAFEVADPGRQAVAFQFGFE